MGFGRERGFGRDPRLLGRKDRRVERVELRVLRALDQKLRRLGQLRDRWPGEAGRLPSRSLVELRELAERRQLAQLLQPEEQQEVGGRAVQERPADLLLLADDLHQVPLEQAAKRAPGVHPPNGLDLRFGDRLTVGDDGQGLERRLRQAHGLGGEVAAHERGVLRHRPQLKTACDLFDPKAPPDLVAVAVRSAVRFEQVVHGALDRRRVRVRIFELDRLDEPPHRDRIGGDEQQGLDDRAQAFISQGHEASWRLTAEGRLGQGPAAELSSSLRAGRAAR